MKTKTLKEIAAQVARINGVLAAKKMTKAEEHRFYKVAEIGRRYSANALYYLKNQMGPADLDEYGASASIPASIYTK